MSEFIAVVPEALVEKVVAFLDQEGNTAFEAQAAIHVQVLAQLVAEHTRANGFDSVTHEPGATVEAVIVLAAGRLLGNPEQLRQQVGNTYVRDRFDGWSAMEKKLLNTLRGVAA